MCKYCAIGCVIAAAIAWAAGPMSVIGQIAGVVFMAYLVIIIGSTLAFLVGFGYIAADDALDTLAFNRACREAKSRGEQFVTVGGATYYAVERPTNTDTGGSIPAAGIRR